MLLGVAPILFLAVPLLLISSFARRDPLGFGLILVAVFAVAAVIGTAMLEDRAAFVSLRTGLPLVIAAVAALAWLFHEEEDWRAFIGVVVVVAPGRRDPALLARDADLLAPEPGAGLHPLRRKPRESQEGTESLGGYTVGIDPELAMSNYINDTLKPPENSILTDSKVTYGVVLMTGKPQPLRRPRRHLRRRMAVDPRPPLRQGPLHAGLRAAPTPT